MHFNLYLINLLRCVLAAKRQKNLVFLQVYDRWPGSPSLGLSLVEKFCKIALAALVHACTVLVQQDTDREK